MSTAILLSWILFSSFRLLVSFILLRMLFIRLLNNPWHLQLGVVGNNLTVVIGVKVWLIGFAIGLPSSS
jgi:hypothetical protein